MNTTLLCRRHHVLVHEGGYRMSRFVVIGEYKVRGLRNRYRQAGIGAPLAAEVIPVGSGPEAEAARKRIPPRTKVPVTAFVRIENVFQGIADGRLRGRIELYPADVATTVEVEGRKLPLELEPTATLAYQLEGAPVWDTELGSFLSAEFKVFGPYEVAAVSTVFMRMEPHLASDSPTAAVVPGRIGRPKVTGSNTSAKGLRIGSSRRRAR